jgi:hypothetical protein
MGIDRFNNLNFIQRGVIKDTNKMIISNYGIETKKHCSKLSHLDMASINRYYLIFI